MPEEFDRCVRALMGDPNFKSENKEESKRDAAYAVCVASYKKRHGGKSPFTSSQLWEQASLKDLVELDPYLKLTVVLLEADRTMEGINE